MTAWEMRGRRLCLPYMTPRVDHSTVKPGRRGGLPSMPLSASLHRYPQGPSAAVALLYGAVAVLLLSACGDKPMSVVTTIDTLCTVTTRYHATDAQAAALKADPTLWQSLVDWLYGFNKERDKRCLQPAKGA